MNSTPPPIVGISLKIQKTTRVENIIEEISKVISVPKGSIILAMVSCGKIIGRVSDNPRSFFSY
jgi:hypothetical protein